MRFHPALFNQFRGGSGVSGPPEFIQAETITGATVTLSPDLVEGDLAILSIAQRSNSGTQEVPPGFTRLAYTDANSSSFPEIQTVYKVLDGSETTVAVYGSTCVTNVFVIRGARTDRAPVVTAGGSANPRTTMSGFDYSVDAIQPSSISGGLDIITYAAVSTFNTVDPTGFTFISQASSPVAACYAGAYYKVNPDGEPYAGGFALDSTANTMSHTISVPGPRDPAPIDAAWLVALEMTVQTPFPTITNDAQVGDLAILAYVQETNITFDPITPVGWTDLDVGNGARKIVYKFLEVGDIGTTAPEMDTYGTNGLWIYRNAGVPVRAGGQYVRNPPTAVAGVAQPPGSIDLILHDRNGWEGTPNVGGSPNGASPPGYTRYLGFMRNGSGVASILESWERNNPGDTYTGGPFSPATDEYRNFITTICIPKA